jgi:tetratricopeptide (TPR) repeat protein
MPDRRSLYLSAASIQPLMDECAKTDYDDSRARLQRPTDMTQPFRRPLLIASLPTRFLLGLILSTVLCGNTWAYDLRDNAVLHANNGQLFMERQQYGQAIEEFKAALQLNPYSNLSASLYNNLGLAYRAIGNYTFAYASFQRACRIQPTFSLYYQNLIETYALAGKLVKVQQELEATLKENPDNAEAWFMLGLLYKEQGNQKAAKGCFERFVKLSPESEMTEAARKAL